MAHRTKVGDLLPPVETLWLLELNGSPSRLAIDWDPVKSELWFGASDGTRAVRVSSSKQLENWNGSYIHPLRLLPVIVDRFLKKADPPDGGILLTEIANLLCGYVYYKDKRVYTMLAAWVMGSYLYPLFGFFGYLFFYSKRPRSGKTRIEEVLSHLAFQASGPVTAPTVPVIRDTAAEGGTLILDTLERWSSKSPEVYGAAMELLDAGFRNGGKIPKMVKNAEGNWIKTEIPVFAPYIMAGINRDSLTETALDRSFDFDMERKPTVIRTRPYSSHRCEKECLPIRDRLYRWALHNACHVFSLYEGEDLFGEIERWRLNDRAADIWKPLLAVAMCMDQSAVCQTLRSLASEMGKDPEAEERTRHLSIVKALKQETNSDGVVVGMTSNLRTRLRSRGIELTENELHGVLTEWGFSQKSVRLEEGPRRSWELQRSELDILEAAFSE